MPLGVGIPNGSVATPSSAPSKATIGHRPAKGIWKGFFANTSQDENVEDWLTYLAACLHCGAPQLCLLVYITPPNWSVFWLYLPESSTIHSKPFVNKTVNHPTIFGAPTLIGPMLDPPNRFCSCQRSVCIDPKTKRKIFLSCTCCGPTCHVLLLMHTHMAPKCQQPI